MYLSKVLGTIILALGQDAEEKSWAGSFQSSQTQRSALSERSS